MADEAAFNLSAAISLQLATGAGAALRKQIDNIKNIEVPVTFKDVSASEQEKLIKKALKPIPIKVKFDRESVRANLTEEVLLGMMTKAQKNIVIPIKIQWDKDTAAKLQEVQKNIEKLTKYADKLKKASGVNNVNTGVAAPITAGGKAAKAAVDDVDELIGSLKKLSKQSKDATFGDVQKGKNFFQQAEAQIDRLAKKLKGLGASDGLSKLKEKFQGIGGDESARNNLLRSLTTLFKGLTDVKDAEEQVKAAGKNLGKSFNMTDALKGVKETRESITSLFDSMASSDPNTFSISMISSVRKMQKSIGQSINIAGKDLRAFDSLLSSLNQKKAIAKDAKNTESVKNIGKLIQEVKDQYKSGASVSDIKSSARFQELNALLGNLKYIEQGAKRAEIAMDNLTRKASKELKASKGGQLLGLDATATFIGRQAGRDIRKTSDPAEIAKIVDIAKNAYNEVAQRADKVNRQFDRLESQIIKFEESDFTNAANSLKNYRAELEKLVLAGTSIPDIDNSVTRELAKAANIQGLDAKINTAVRQIERLKSVLDFSAVDDVSGAKAQLEALKTSLQSQSGKYAGLTTDSLNKNVASDLFDIRAAQRFNETLDNSVQKIRNVGAANENLGVEKIYSKYADDLEKQGRRIANSASSMGEKLAELRRTTDKNLINAKFDSEGGFFGSVAKSAGLAIKRLGAFLVLAQSLYSIQSVFTSVLSDAVKVDKEFVRLEQVFNKSFSGSQLTEQLKETKNQVTELAKTLGVSALEVANSAQTLAQAGIEGRDLKILLDTIAKSQLGPSFGNASETAEASIAIFRQFNLTAEGTKKALGGINQLSAQYAVEAKGITEAIRRAGGVFAAAGDDVGSFAAAFTLVKQKTREADESIATGLRNVAQRLQTSAIQKKLKEALGVNLVDNGEFVGFEESITRIGTALKGVSKQSTLFAQVREIIGGQRQGGRVNPLLEDFEEFEKLKKTFSDGADSIEKDMEVAFNSIENKLLRARGAFEQFVIEIINSDFVKFLVEGFTQITTLATNMLRVLNSVPGAIIAIGVAAKALSNSRFVGQALLSQIVPRTTLLKGKNKGGPIGFNSGGANGFIPGGGPNRDSILAYLTTGEYVLKRKAVKKYGRTFLDNLNDGSINANKGGLIPGFVGGGFISKLFSGKKRKTEKIIQNIRDREAAREYLHPAVVAEMKGLSKSEILTRATQNADTYGNRSESAINIREEYRKNLKTAGKDDPNIEKLRNAGVNIPPSLLRQGADQKSIYGHFAAKDVLKTPEYLNSKFNRRSSEVRNSYFSQDQDAKTGRKNAYLEYKDRQSRKNKQPSKPSQSIFSKIVDSGANLSKNVISSFQQGIKKGTDKVKSAIPSSSGIKGMVDKIKGIPTALKGLRGAAKGLPTLPTSVAAPISGPKSTHLGVLAGLLKSGGLDIKNDNLSNIVKEFKTGNIDRGKRIRDGYANPLKREIGIKDITSKNAGGRAVHELAHLLETNLSAKAVKSTVNKLPKEFKESVKARVLSQSNNYGKEGSKGFNSRLNKEIFAEAVRATAGGSSQANNKGFIQLEKQLNSLGVNVIRPQKSDQPIDPSRARRANTPLSRKRANASTYGPVFSSAAQEAVASDPTVIGSPAQRAAARAGLNNARARAAARAGRSGSGSSPPPPPPPNGPPPFSPFSPIPGRSAAKVASSTVSLGASFAALKGNSIQLASAFFILQGVLGALSPALAEMVTAMATMAVSMYALSKTGAAVGFAKNAAGAGAKAIQTQKARGIAEAFNLGRVLCPNTVLFTF